MQADKLKQTFDHQASSYDQQWARMAPIRECMHLLLEAPFADLPETARILCVGAGTGIEIAHFAKRYPGWRFLALDPSGAMLDVCRERAEREGYLDRCEFHEGYLDALPATPAFDGATCFLVSHFMLGKEARTAFFRTIGERLKPGGLLACSDLSADTAAQDYPAMLELWFRTMNDAGLTAEALERMRSNYAKDVAILAPRELDGIVQQSGFARPLHFYQAGMIRAWHASRAS